MVSVIGIRCDCGWSSKHRTETDNPELSVRCNQDFDAHAQSCWRAAKYIEEQKKRYGIAS